MNRRVHNGSSAFADSELAAWIGAQNQFFLGSLKFRLSTVQVQRVTSVELVGFLGRPIQRRLTGAVGGHFDRMERSGPIVFTSASRRWQQPDERCRMVFPSFGHGFDSHRPLQILKDLRSISRFPLLSVVSKSRQIVLFFG